MYYYDFYGKSLSALGLGCMRLPTRESFGDIDMDMTARMIETAFRGGINYFDTAWGYHNGESERAMGALLKNYPRESFYLASKFPGYDLSNMDKVEEIFEEQLKKCQTDYFDFYLVHNVCELNIDAYLDTRFGIYDYLIEQKKNGRIRHLGFSTHATQETFERFLEAYGDAMEFCQIQLNWLDYEFQNAKQKLQTLRERNIPVWVMEPVRGGHLCQLSEPYRKRLETLAPERSLPAWAFRWLQGIPQVAVTLSGMSNLQQLEENIALFDQREPLPAAHEQALADIAYELTHTNTVPCTGCRYCVTHCPQELDIPRLIELYNEHVYSGGGFIAPMAMSAIDEMKRPSACIGCGACEAVCPQTIRIRDMMTDFVKRLSE